MAWGLKRYHESRQLHFLTFNCYDRAPLLGAPHTRDTFLQMLEYGFVAVGYVVMPEHVHFLVSEPERRPLALALQMIKQMVSSKLLEPAVNTPFWSPRYYDFSVWNESKRKEKLGYLHRNPVKRGLVTKPEDWEWSSFRPTWRGGPCGGRVAIDRTQAGTVWEYSPLRLDANSPTKPSLREKRDRLGHPRYNSRSTGPMFNELDCVILTKPLLEGDVPVGCTGVILMVYTEPTAGYEVEFFDTTHKSLGTFTITDNAHLERQI